MKDYLEQLNKAFESKVRLGIMAALTVNDQMDFNALKELLQLTDGNLASHLRALELADYISVRKSFIGRKPNTRFRITSAGKRAFEAHLAALENFLKNF